MERRNFSMDEVVSYCNQYGFIFQGSEIYGGLANTWDYGPLGTRLKNQVKDAWRYYFIQMRENSYEVDADILMNPKVWEASGHLMFETKRGVTDDSSSRIFLRPENAQGEYVNYLNVMRSMRAKLPFSIGQIGKAFRNEITPKNFTFMTMIS